MKVLVTGGLGFIGGHVVEELIKRNITPVVFDRFPPKSDNDLRLPQVPFEFFFGDIRDRNAVSEAVGFCDGAINLAGVLGTSETVDNPFPSAEANIMGGLNFLEACRQHKKKGVQIAVGNHFMNNTYAITKTTIERMALMYNKEHGTQIAVVRGLNVYGPRQKHKPVRKITPNFICQALRGEPIKIFGSGESVMDMIYVKDIAAILVDALFSHDIYDKTFSAGCGVKTTVNDIANLINKIVGNMNLVSSAGVEHIDMRAGEVDNSIVLGEPETLLPLAPENIDHYPLLSLEEGMAKTIEWYKTNYPWQED